MAVKIKRDAAGKITGLEHDSSFDWDKASRKREFRKLLFSVKLALVVLPGLWLLNRYFG